VTLHADIAVLGAGPAGAAVARRLLGVGARVVVIPGVRAHPSREGFSIRTCELLRAEGFEEVLASMAAPVRRSGSWGDGRSVVGSECLADRAVTAQAIKVGLVRSGALLCAGPARRVVRTATGYHIDCASTPVETRLIVDARGRRGPQERGPLLLAAGQRFATNTGVPHTEVHAWSEGWCWIADDGVDSYVQLVARGGRGAFPTKWFVRAAREIQTLADTTAAPRIGDLIAAPAYARLGRPSDDFSLWRVGDAALALDPLSGQGVFEALRGAATVAAALRTVLEGGDAALAARFVRERYAEAWIAALTSAQGFYAENAARGAFWRDTAAAYGLLARPQAPEPTRIEHRPVLDRGVVRERAVVVTARTPRGVWHVDGVPVVALLDLLKRSTSSAELMLDAQRCFDRPPAAVETALRWLRTSGAAVMTTRASVLPGG
jgi:menaquinone-9 beta-reductase